MFIEEEKKKRQQRLDECLRIAMQLKEYGIYDIASLKLRSKWSAFVKDGVTSSGTVFIEPLNRHMDYQFSTRVPSFVKLWAQR